MPSAFLPSIGAVLPSVAIVTVSAIALGACSSGPGAGGSFAEAACPAVMQWADDSVTAVNEFQEQSPKLPDAAARRTSYEATFTRLDAVAASLATEVDALPYPKANREEIHQRLGGAVARVRSEYADDLRQAQGLPDAAFAAVSVNDGRLFTGNEKAKAIVFDTVGKIWQDFHVVDDNCGRHPPVTVDLHSG